MTATIGFDKDTARRIKRVVTQRPPPPRPYVEEVPYVREFDAAITTSSIPASQDIGGGEIAPGNGTGRSLEFIDPNTGNAKVFNPLKNYFTSEIAQNTICIVARTRRGNWVVISTDCP